MKLSMAQQIINFIDCNHSVTVGQILREFDNDMITLLCFEELLDDGQIRQVVANKLLGTYKYCLAA
jgi:hypothetical protein